MDDIVCATCGGPIGKTWVQVTVRDEMHGSEIHKVGFLCDEDCLVTFAGEVKEDMR